MNLLSTVILTLALAASIVHGQNFAPPQSIGQAYYAGTCTADLPPVSLMVQAACLAPFTPVGPPPIVGPGNPYFTAADAYEVRIQ